MSSNKIGLRIFCLDKKEEFGETTTKGWIE